MGMGRLGDIAAALIAAGPSAGRARGGRPVGTTPRQRSVVATLGTLGGRRVEEAGLGPPSVIVVGPVAGWRRRSGRGARPLAGRRVVVTRARAQASELSERLRALGAAVTELARDPHRAAPERTARLGARGPGRLRPGRADERQRRGRPLRRAGRPGPRRPRAVRGGDGGRDRPGDRRAPGAGGGCAPTWCPSASSRRGSWRRSPAPLEGARALVARAAGLRPELVDGLERLGARVDEVLLYEAVPEPADPAAIAEAARRGLPHVHRLLDGPRLRRAARRRRARASRTAARGWSRSAR